MTAVRSPVPLMLAAALCLAVAGCERDEAEPVVPKAAAPAAALDTVAAAVAPASAKDEVGRVMDSFLAARSYHANLQTANPQGTLDMEMDFVAPDRYRMKTPMGTQYVIGDTMYMTMNGRTMKMPLPKGQLANYRDPASLEANKADMTVEALGADTVEGQAAKKYLLRTTRPAPGESTMWVGADGYPLKIEVASDTGGATTRTTIRYSRFNDPMLRIDPP